MVSALKGLVEKDFVTHEKNEYYVYDLFFQLWIEKCYWRKIIVFCSCVHFSSRARIYYIIGIGLVFATTRGKKKYHVRKKEIAREEAVFFTAAD